MTTMLAAAGGVSPLVEDLGMCLVVSAMFGVLFERLRIPTIAALLGAGVLIGPVGLSLVNEQGNIETIANLGLTLLLFVIGLEVHVGNMLASGRVLLVTGLLQVPLTLALAGLAFLALRLSSWELLAGPYVPLYLGAACAFSSTLLVVKLLQERLKLEKHYGVERTPDGRQRYTFLPHVVGDGKDGVFRACEWNATSSLYEPNVPLLSYFTSMREAHVAKERIPVKTRALDELPEDFAYRLLDVVLVQGKTEPVPIYELVAEKGDITSLDAEFLNLFSRAVAAYQGRQWDVAKTKFGKLLEGKPGDRACQIFMERCEEYKIKPPPEDWAGEYAHAKK